MFSYAQITCIILVLMVTFQGIQCKRNQDEMQQDNIAHKQNRGIGISAWGLVILILTLILLGVAAYYIALFYPMIWRVYNIKYRDACVQTDF